VSPSELAKVLRNALLRRSPPVDAARRDAELDALTVAHARRYGERPRRASKWLLATGLVAAAAVGACVVPVDYEAEMGQRLAFTMSASDMSELDIEAIARFVEDEHAPDELRISGHAQTESWSHETTDGARTHTMKEMRVELEAVGEDLDADALWDDLVEEFPALAGAKREDEALHGTVHGTLGGRLSDRWLDVTIDRDGVEEAKRQLIEQLVAEGVQGTPQVEIIDEDLGDMRRREVRVRIE
jgi:hypothetical protein